MDTRKLGILLLSVISATLGLQVSIPQTTYEVARGDEVTITCSFQPKNPVNRLIVIAWTGEPDGSFDDEGISFGTFYSDINHVDINAMYEGKVRIESDVNQKESKLFLKHVTLRESRRIKCLVQIPGDTEGQTSDSTSLVVLVAPSYPVCRIKGTTEYGQNISLTCMSEEGSPVPTYQWQSYDVKNFPRPLPPKSTEKDGVLSLFNVSRDTSGYYICTSTNKVRSATCNLTLSVMPSTMKIGATAGIIGGCVAGVAVLVLTIYCCCRRKQQPEEFAMESPVIEYHDIPKQEKQEDGSRDEHLERHGEDRDIYSRGRHEGRREEYDGRKPHYNNQKNRYDEHRRESDDLRHQHDDQQNRYDSRNDCYNDQQDRYSNHRDRYNDRQDRSNDHKDRYDNQQEHYNDHGDDHLRDRCDNGRDQGRQTHYDDDRNSFDGRSEDYDDCQGRYHNHRYHYER